MRQAFLRTHNLSLATLLVLGLCLPSYGLSAEPTVLLDQLRPGQTHIGRATIQTMVTEAVEKAHRKNLEKHESKTPLEALAEKAASTPLPVVKTPDGTYMLLDGHHRTTTLTTTFENALAAFDREHAEGAVRPEMPKVAIELIQDFSKKSWKDLGAWMVKHKKVYFGHEVLEQARRSLKAPAQLSDEEFLKQYSEVLCRDYLPKTFKGMINSPMRSAVGTVLFKLGNALAYQERFKPEKERLRLDGENQAEYIEFLIGDRLKKRGVVVAEGRENDPDVLKAVEDAIFDNPQELGFLRNSYRTESSILETRRNKKIVADAVDAVWAIHKSKRAASQPLTTQPQAQPQAEAQPGGP